HLHYGLGQVDLSRGIETNPAVQTIKIDFGNGVANLDGINTVGGLDRFDECLDIGYGRSGVIIGLVTETFFVLIGELFGIAEILVLQSRRWHPRTHPERIVRVLAQSSSKVGAGHTDSERIELRVDVKSLGLANKIQDFGFMAGDENRIDALVFD